MTAQEALKSALRDRIGPVARSRGYKGTAPTWRKESALGDWAIVNVQSSSSSSAERLRCVINLAFAPEPWLRWQAAQLGSGMPKSVNETLGLYRQRLHRTGALNGVEGWWEVTDATSAEIAVADMGARLADDGWDTLDAMFSRDTMMERLLSGDLGMVQGPRARVLGAQGAALLLMDDGPSDALDQHLEYAVLNISERKHESAQRFEVWVRSQAQKAS